MALIEHLRIVRVQGPPSLPLQVIDFNFDRFNDLILVTRDGIYGYVQVCYGLGVASSSSHARLSMILSVKVASAARSVHLHVAPKPRRQRWGS